MSYYSELADLTARNNRIPGDAYNRYGVKHGLRNKDGTGVLVGLTSVSTVIGYAKDNGSVLPVRGELYYRGRAASDLVTKYVDEGRFGFEQTAYLLLFGKMPTDDELTHFTRELRGMLVMPRNFPRDVLETFRTQDIMNSLGRSVLTLYSIDDDAADLSLTNQVRQAMELIARMVVLVPYSYYVIRHAFHGGSLIMHPPDPELSLAQNFLKLLRPDSEYTDLEARVLDLSMLLHADHGGGNNSTFVTRAVSSTMTDIYSAVAASIGSLKGPLHGGANTHVVRMMDDLKATVSNPTSESEVTDYLVKVLNKDAYDRSGKIYGIGHAVYTLSDPRAVVLKEQARELAADSGKDEEFAMYDLVEKLAPAIFQEFKGTDKPMSANVDFYSGLVYDFLKIPREVFTPLFAIGRMAGWCAHRLELMSNPVKIVRPAFRVICDYCSSGKDGACPVCRFEAAK